MSRSITLLIIGTLLGSLFASAAAASGSGLNLLAYLDYPDRNPPQELYAARYYEVYDRDFVNGGISGWIELQALKVPDGSEHQALDTPTGNWVDYLSARLFRDEIEMGPAEFEIHFARKPLDGAKHAGVQGPVVVTRKSPARATFTLSGPDGAPLEPGIYRLWIMLDTREIPPGPGVYRALVVDDAGAYHLHGTPDPARKGGLVFKVQSVGSDPDLQAGYFTQQASIEEGKAMGFEEIGKVDDKSAAVHRRKSIALALQGLSVSPNDPTLLLIVGRNYAVLNECPKALPYFEKLQKVAPGVLVEQFRHNMAVSSCGLQVIKPLP